MKLSKTITKKIIKKLMRGEDYRAEVLSLINTDFLSFALDFFMEVANAKIKNEQIDIDWYKKELVDQNPSIENRIINSGLNKKTIFNSYKTTRRDVVLSVTEEHYEDLVMLINELIEKGEDIDIKLSIKFNSVSIELNINESLIVINTLAVKRAQIRGGAWSTTGKQVEKILMLTLCNIYNVSDKYYYLTGKSSEEREVDFFLLDSNKVPHLCEVKLMGAGNPESADAIIARDTHVFIADTLSGLNTNQFEQRNVKWVELHTEGGYKKFEQILEAYNIPHKKIEEEISNEVIDNSIENGFKFVSNNKAVILNQPQLFR